MPRSHGFAVPRVNWSNNPTVTAVTARDTRLSMEAPRVPWDVFLDRYFAWEQGQHVGVIGPTGQGKTSLLMALLPLQPYVVVFATKPSDASMVRLVKQGYFLTNKWVNIPADKYPRRVLWPDATAINSEVTQREVFKDAFARIYREKGWCVAIDEGWWIAKHLKLEQEIKTFLLQGRSLGISLVFATQRPVDVPLEVYDQSTHLFFYRDNDERNLSRLSGISYRSSDLIRHLVSELDQYQFLYINTRTGKMVRSRAPIPMVTEGGYQNDSAVNA